MNLIKKITNPISNIKRKDLYTKSRLLFLMEEKPIIVKEKKCLRCGHKWLPRIKDVRQCPLCKSVRFYVKK